MADAGLKVCVLGPPKSGKTLLCRTLADQPLSSGTYQPTVAVRYGEVTRRLVSPRAPTVRNDKVPLLGRCRLV